MKQIHVCNSSTPYLISARILSRLFVSRSVSRVRLARCSSCDLLTSDLKPAMRASCSSTACADMLLSAGTQISHSGPGGQTFSRAFLETKASAVFSLLAHSTSVMCCVSTSACCRERPTFSSVRNCSQWAVKSGRMRLCQPTSSTHQAQRVYQQ